MNDLRFAFRQLWKSPGFTVVAVLALALGIGANTAIFSVVNAVLLKPLPYPQPEQLVAVGADIANQPETAGGLASISFPDFADFRAQMQTLASLAVHRERSLALSAAGEARSLRGREVSSEFFDVLQAKPSLGRTFRRDEEAAGGGPDGLTVVLSQAFWQKQFRGDRAALGQVLILNGQPHTVVGIMPAGFQFPLDGDPVDAYVTSAADASSPTGGKPNNEQRGNHMWQAVGRLRAGTSAGAARSELRGIASALAKQYPDTNHSFSVALVPLRDDLVGDISRGLYVLTGAVVCVLLIASANVANLLLARATVRGKEIALRAALGASRGRLMRQLLTESVLLSATGGLVGLLFASWGTDLLVALVPQNIPRTNEIRLDGAVLGFTILVSLATGILFGLAPAWQGSRLDLREALNEGGRGAIGTGRQRLRSGLVVTEIALALVLLTGAGLLLQSFQRLSKVDPGLQTERLLTGFVSLPSSAYPKPQNVQTFFEQLLPRLRALPGVEAVGTIYPMPLSGSHTTTSFDIEERPLPKAEQQDSAARIASADYFRTQGIPLLRGRFFDATDRSESRPVMIINQRFAETYFPGEDAIGKRVAPGWTAGAEEEGPQREIVGIVGNVRYRSLRAEFTPEMYMPLAQVPIGAAYLVVRTGTSTPATLTAAVRDELARVDAGVPLTRVKVYDEYLARALARPRFNALLLSVFAAVALLLTALGIYGVMAYHVVQSRREIGIRMALGAQTADVLRLILGGGMKLTGLGVAIGIAASFAVTRLLSNLLYGVAPFDALTLGAVALLLSAIALLACWLPARRAARVDPITTLRAE